MNNLFSQYIAKFFVHQWTIGLIRGSMDEIIRSKTFNRDIKWLPIQSKDKFYADPFLLKLADGMFNIFIEDFSFTDNYGKISLMTVDKDLNQTDHTVLLDTQSHLSYPFIFQENSKTYIFPEASKSGKLSCYEYDPFTRSLSFLKNVIDIPLLDSTILKYQNKYWLFGSIREKGLHYNLNVFFSDNLLGPYIAHPKNPVKRGINGVRPAGNFIEVDGIIYRPSQNNRSGYGDSVSINKINLLNEMNAEEEHYMSVCVNKNNQTHKGIRAIHTINSVNDLIVVDGIRWRFSFVAKLKQVLRLFGFRVFL